MLGESEITVGGVRVTCAQALEACDILASSGACAIRSVLAARGNPLASCDYHAVYRPGLDAARAALERTGRPGGAGRHLAKHAFALAVRHEVAAAACRAFRKALSEVARDERYITAIARDVSALRRAPQSVPAPEAVITAFRVTGEESATDLDEAALHYRGIRVTGEESEADLAEAAAYIRAGRAAA
jgi:hypothetical protein